MKANELLAEHAHLTWSSWMLYLFVKSDKNDDGSITIPSLVVERLTKLMNTPYKELSETEKENSKEEAIQIQKIFLGDE